MPKRSITLYRLTLSAMLLAIGMVLPFLTGQMGALGQMLLPLHIPVFLCGAVCGWGSGAVVGAVLPLLRAVLFGMPPLYPTALIMALELSVYGLTMGVFYRGLGRCRALSVYPALLGAMIAGRMAWGAASWLLLSGEGFTLQAFLNGALLTALPGILIQLILIPLILTALKKAAPGFLFEER